MNSERQYLIKDSRDTKRLCREFADMRIEMGWNQKQKRNETWYIPCNSRPYLICCPKDVSHAIQLLRDRMKHDKMRAVDLLEQIDAHNEKLIADKQKDAMLEVRSQLKNVAAGRRFYTF